MTHVFARMFCEGDETDQMGSICTQGAVIDILNLAWALVFYLIICIGFTTRKYSIRWMRIDWVHVGVSVCCGLLSFLCFVDGVWKLGMQKWLPLLFVRGLIWGTLSLSLYVEGSKPAKVAKSAWWVVFFLLVSCLNVEILVNSQRVGAVGAVSWIVSFLLMVCGLRSFRRIISPPTARNGLAESLLVRESDSTSSNLSEASFVSKLLFCWINPLVRLGNSKVLALEDIPNLGSEDEASLAYRKFSFAFEMERGASDNAGKNIALWAIAKVYWKDMLLVGTFALLRVIAVVTAPLLLYAFVNFSNRERTDLRQGLLLVGCLVVVKVVESLSYRHFFFYSRRTGMRMRSALMVAVYRKQLKLSSLGRQRHSTGEVVNYIAVDAYRMGEFPMWFHLGWSYTLQLFLSIFVLFGVVGLGVLPGLVPLLICGLLNVPFAKMLQKCQTEFMIFQDKRLRSLSEILNNMKIIKLQSWEDKFKSLIESHRENEWKWLAKSQYQKTYSTAMYWMSPTVVSSVVFFGCILLASAPFDASTIFTVLATLRTMSEPVRTIPDTLSTVIQVKVSFDRINSFLHEEELRQDAIQREPPPSDASHVVRVRAGFFSWDRELVAPTIRNVDLDVRRGEKVVVCGHVGAGKSSLLYAILGEISKISGIVDVFGSVAYVSQSPWIESGTLRDNILHGKPMDKSKYDEAIRVSALDKDINSFEYGDLTEIGQRGLNMSGGQKQRIQIARAVYSDADIYLLDDPFSAVDAHTGAALFKDCVMTALCKKTVILVTHQVEFLTEVDIIQVMKHGEITQSGSYSNLLMEGTVFEQLVNAHRNAVMGLDALSYENGQQTEIGYADAAEESKKRSVIEENSKEKIPAKPGIQLTEEEQKETGNVGWRPFLDYVIVSKGRLYMSLNIITQTAFIALQAAASYWLALAIQNPKWSSVMIVAVYTLISASAAVFVYLRSLFAVLLGLRASNAFFSGFTNSIFKAPMLFFDSTPVGRILTRASSDLSVLDYDIPMAYVFVTSGGLEILTTIGVMTSVTWQVLIVGIFAILAANYVQGYYQPSAREMMRISGITKAPVMNHAAETSLGVATIRAFNMVDRFFHNFLKLVDNDAKVFLCSNASMEWLVLRCEALQNLTLFTTALFLVLLPQGYIAPGLVGLSLSYAFSLTMIQVFVTRWYSSLSNYMISVERIKQFMDIPSEPPAVVEDKRPPSSWPSRGRIDLQDLQIRYRPNAPVVLKGITCTFQEGTKVGVVGRTGSGKTTLIGALFRLVEPYSGSILIDNLNICSIGLKDLRLKLSIIPQEPTLFRGSIRTNLDPLGLYSEDEIWKVLEKCQLKDTVKRLPNLLDYFVSDEGENWSMGQRQLLCLGRVLLKRNRILVLDEATASIDSATDAVLQKIIREEFSDCTVITVAHRVPTVMDGDMVMVLSFGEVLEYDEPSKLMQTDSAFSKLVDEYWSSSRKNIQKSSTTLN